MYLIDDIDEDGNIIDELEDCKIIEVEEDNPLSQILKILYVDE